MAFKFALCEMPSCQNMTNSEAEATETTDKNTSSIRGQANQLKQDIMA
jgi:hypothetical protein